MDTIVVSTNEKMQEVIDWYKDNQAWLETFEFKVPFQDGIIKFEEEKVWLEFHGNNLRNFYNMKIYMDEYEVAEYDYYPIRHTINNTRIVSSAPKERRKSMMQVLEYDKTVNKCTVKFEMLMQFALHFEKMIKVDNRTRKPSVSKHSATVATNNVKSLGRRLYISEVPQMKDGKRTYTKPEHEVTSRGHYRHYKSGKTVWINEITRYKGKSGDAKKDTTWKV